MVDKDGKGEAIPIKMAGGGGEAVPRYFKPFLGRLSGCWLNPYDREGC